jgi:PTS system nitrogen regulatory IIA component
MQLTVRDVAKFLDVSESTVTRWIKQRGLPAQLVTGQYHLNRAEVLEWATANQIKVSVELFEHLESDAEPVPSLAAALEAGGIFHRLPAKDKREALRALVQVLPLPAEFDREFLLRLLLAREAAAPTAIGSGIALPHVRNPIVLQVEHPLVTVGFLEQPVDFGALDGKPVQALFSLICPTMRTHLLMLSRLSFAMHDPAFHAAVMRQGTREDLLHEAERIEADLRVPKASEDAGGPAT